MTQKQKDWDEVNGEKQEVDSSHKVKHIKKSCRIAWRAYCWRPPVHDTIIRMITNCCSIDSEMTHRCCHLSNNFVSRRIFYVLHSGPGDATQKLPLPVENKRPHLIWFSGPGRVHNPNGISIGLDVFVPLVVVTNRHIPTWADAETTLICSNRPHLFTAWSGGPRGYDFCGRSTKHGSIAERSKERRQRWRNIVAQCSGREREDLRLSK